MHDRAFQPPALLAQDLVLFNDTIYYNIQYGNLAADREQVERAAKQAAIHDQVCVSQGMTATVS